MGHCNGGRRKGSISLSDLQNPTKRAATTATALFLAWCCIAGGPATQPSADLWFDRARNDLLAARQQPWNRYDHPAEGELCLMLVHQRGNEQDRALLASLAASLAKRVDPELAKKVEFQDEIVAEVVTLDACAKLMLNDPSANEVVDEALREIDKSEAKLLRSDLAHYLALRGQYDRARVVAVAPFTSPLSTSSWLALWLGEGGHAELRDRALRDAYDHVRPHPPQMRDFDLKTLAQSHAHATLFDAAFNVVNDINTPVEKMNAYAAVGERAFIKGRRGVVARVLKEAQAVPLGIGSYCQFNLAELAAQFGDREAFDHFATLSERTLNEYTYWSRAKHLAKGYAIFDMRDQHRLLMDKALKALSAKDADDKDGGARLALAASYVFLNEDKRVADAIAAAKKLDRRAVEGYSFWEIFEAYLDHGRINDARALMAKWVPEDDRDTFHTSLALTLVRKRELAAARKELGHIKHSSLPHTVMSLLARAYARAGRLDDAAKWIDSFESPRTRAALNLAIANALAGRENYYSRILYPDWDQRR